MKAADQMKKLNKRGNRKKQQPSVEVVDSDMMMKASKLTIVHYSEKIETMTEVIINELTGLERIVQQLQLFALAKQMTEFEKSLKTLNTIFERVIIKYFPWYVEILQHLTDVERMMFNGLIEINKIVCKFFTTHYRSILQMRKAIGSTSEEHRILLQQFVNLRPFLKQAIQKFDNYPLVVQGSKQFRTDYLGIKTDMFIDFAEIILNEGLVELSRSYNENAPYTVIANEDLAHAKKCLVQMSNLTGFSPEKNDEMGINDHFRHIYDLKLIVAMAKSDINKIIKYGAKILSFFDDENNEVIIKQLHQLAQLFNYLGCAYCQIRQYYQAIFWFKSALIINNILQRITNENSEDIDSETKNLEEEKLTCMKNLYMHFYKTLREAVTTLQINLPFPAIDTQSAMLNLRFTNAKDFATVTALLDQIDLEYTIPVEFDKESTTVQFSFHNLDRNIKQLNNHFAATTTQPTLLNNDALSSNTTDTSIVAAASSSSSNSSTVQQKKIDKSSDIKPAASATDEFKQLPIVALAATNETEIEKITTAIVWKDSQFPPSTSKNTALENPYSPTPKYYRLHGYPYKLLFTTFNNDIFKQDSTGVLKNTSHFFARFGAVIISNKLPFRIGVTFFKAPIAKDGKNYICEMRVDNNVKILGYKACEGAITKTTEKSGDDKSNNKTSVKQAELIVFDYLERLNSGP